MKFSHRTTVPETSYAGINFVERQSDIREPGGRAVFRATVVVPDTWGQVAVDILAQKYLRKAGVPDRVDRVIEEKVPVWLLRSVPAEGAAFGMENDCRQVFRRIAGCWTYWGWRLGYFAAPDFPRAAGASRRQWQWDRRKAEEASALAFFREVERGLADQRFAPASPQWFNAGLHWAYGTEITPAGQWAIRHESLSDFIPAPGDPGTVEPVRNPYERPAVHACFIQGVEDNLVEDRGITDLVRREALVFRFGGGSGTNFSPLRGDREPLSGGGVSSGLLSWLRTLDRNAGSIKSGGTTRRAARMVVLDADHPDIEEFTSWKTLEERKVAAMRAGSALVRHHLDRVYHAASGSARTGKTPTADLTRARIDAQGAGVPDALILSSVLAARDGLPNLDVPEIGLGYEEEGYATVSGQNANNSVRVTNDFMEAVQNNSDWKLYGRVETRKARAEGREPVPCKVISARSLWDRMCRSEWESGDPGIQFDTTVNEWHTCPADGPIRATNPCGEYCWLDDTACNLASLNHVAYLIETKAGAVFNDDAYLADVRLLTVALDITVSMAGYPSREIAEGSRKYRTLGLGYANLGSLLMRMGLAYDSDAGRAWCGALTALTHLGSLHASAEVAAELGAFPRYEDNKSGVERVVWNHCTFADGEDRCEYVGLTFPPRPLRDYPAWEAVGLGVRASVHQMAKVLPELVGKVGLRNAQVTLLAPCGTIGLLMGCDTTGIEPDFALVKFKKLAGGGYFKIINQSVPPALKRLGYSDAQITDITAYALGATPDAARSRLKGEFGAYLSDEGIERVVRALPASMTIADAMSFAVEGNAGSGLLRAMGVTPERERELSDYCCGRMHLEGAPHLNPGHLPVFDCANKCGDGARFIGVDAHLDMMAAAQPSLSGAISKTINMPLEATVADFDRAKMRAWNLGLKSSTVYRDGSKMSQPLSSLGGDLGAIWGDDYYQPDDPADCTNPTPAPLCRPADRTPMPSRRPGVTQKFVIGGSHKVYMRTGEYPDGRLGEIFLTFDKEGSALNGFLSGFAIAVSISLQHGVPLEEFVDAFTFMKFDPAGPIQEHDRIKMCTSVLDAVFRDLAIHYLGRDDLGHVAGDAQGAEPTPPVAARRRAVQGAESEARAARRKGYESEPCWKCKRFALVRSGACLKCDSCGETTGCQ